MGEISDMDWAQHFMMNYAQNLRKDPVNRCKGQKKDHTKLPIGRVIIN